MLRIGEFSKLAKTTIKTLRYYDKVGLLKPAFVDSANGYRYYTENQLNTMRQILSFKEAGMANEAIARILEGKEPEKALAERRLQLKASIDEMNRQLSEIERMLDHSAEQNYTATLKTIDARTVYCCRGYIPNVSHIRSFIKTCNEELHRTNPDIRFSLPDYCCVIYPGDGYRETNVFIEYAQSVDRFGTDTPTLKFKTLEAITAVSVEHHGGYHSLRDAYLYAIRWASEHGLVICGDARERYINGAWNRENEADWLTEIQLPTVPKEPFAL